MSSRPGILASIHKPADGGVSPNRFQPSITAEIRLFWPPLATDDEIAGALAEAVATAQRMVTERRRSR